MGNKIIDDETMKKLNFSIDEEENVKKMVKGIYDSLLFRKASILIPLDIEKRQAKRMDLLKQEIDEHRLFMIYCYYNFTELQLSKNSKDSKDELRFFTTPIEGVLKSDEFYKKLLKEQNDMDKLMPIEDRIEKLQQKTKKSYIATKLMYSDMMAKIEKTCQKVLNIIGTRDPVELTAIMLIIFNIVYDTEIKLMDSAVDKGKSEDDKTEGNKTKGNKTEGNKTEGYKGDPCDANRYLGIDLSFLGFFDALPEECELKKESTKISIVGPVNVQSTNGFKEPNVQSSIQTGGNISKLKQRQKKFAVQYIMPKPVVICKKKSLKRCKRAYVSCKTVMGASRKYCRRSTKKSIVKYYANIRPKGKYTV